MCLSLFLTADELGIQNHLCLLPYGEKSENPTWTTKKLEPYLHYLENGVKVDRMFNGLIFQAISGRKNHYLYPMYAYLGQEAEKVDWNLAISRLFERKVNFDAVARNTAAGETTDIWVTLPYPMRTQTGFGRRELNFKIERDRFLALKWWIRKFLRRWNRATHLHDKLNFRGFVWPRASIDEIDGKLVRKVNAYIRLKGYMSLWLQQYGSAGCIKWQRFGFDAACSHPNFYGAMGPDHKWINTATIFAEHYNTGIQITAGKGAMYKDKLLLDYLDYGYDTGYMEKSLLVYQFPFQTMQDLIKQHPDEYALLHSFINNSYKPARKSSAIRRKRRSKKKVSR
ncbi:DUF4855 domain-containing protein [Siminovitchia terrae]|uniref:DUF4855 domain-containing protein n=1 Tax=Siminovitchia terrae TaxID=1914933 RepID=A0A429XB43_SIMTE|nr:DUF4855 domain-containing protein [Siminovitchia terrae]